MKLGELTADTVWSRLTHEGLILRVGPFLFRVRSDIRSVLDGLTTLYGAYPVFDEGVFVDFCVTISSGSPLRRVFRKQANFLFDGWEPFTPLPQDQAFPLLEWAMNWCVSVHAHHCLMLHSAVLERNGHAVILPAPPGSGKSTLCAGLSHRGWRLLSDELALISLKDASIAPFGRPISLKNQSIEIMKRYVPDAVFSNVVHDTSKGSVALMKVPDEHLHRIDEVAKPRWVVFPKYVAASAPLLVKRSKANSMLELGKNSFNYMVLGRIGFETLSKVIDASECYDFQYSQLDDAVRIFDELVTSAVP